MFKITNTEIARVVQNPKGYVYDFGGRRFFLAKVCQSDGCGFDFCAGLNRTCLDLVRQRVVGMLVTADEYDGLELIDTRLAAAGQVLLIQENGEVVFNGVLEEDCLVVKLEGPKTTRLKMIPDRLYVVGTREGDDNNGLLVRAVSADHASDMLGRLHDLRCSLTTKLLVEGALDRKVGRATGRLERPSQEPRINPTLGTVLVEHGDIADPLPHEVRGMSEKEQEEVVEKGLSGLSSSSSLSGEREYAESEILTFESELVAGAEMLDRFGCQLTGSPNSGTEVSASAIQGALDAISRFESAKSVFGLPAAPAPARPASVDDLAYAVMLVNHADSQVEGMRRKIVFTSMSSDRDGGSSPCESSPTSWICAGLSNPTAQFGGNRVAVGDVREAAGEAARTVSARTEEMLGLTRRARLAVDSVINAHRVWFRLEAYRQRMADLEAVFRANRSPLDGLTGDALEDVSAKIGAATAELYLALRAAGAETSYGRTTLESTEQGKLYQTLNAHPEMLRRISDAVSGMMDVDLPPFRIPSGTEDSSPASLVSLGFGVPTAQLDAVEDDFAAALGVDGFDPDIGVIPADAQEDMESRLSAMFGAKSVTGATYESFMDVAERSALYEDGRVNSPERFV